MAIEPAELSRNQPLTPTERATVDLIVEALKNPKISDHVWWRSRKIQLTHREHQVAELLLQGCRIPQMCELLQLKQRTIKVFLAGLYRKFNLGKNDQVYQPMIQLAVQLHERRAELGVRCHACDEELKLDPWPVQKQASKEFVRRFDEESFTDSNLPAELSSSFSQIEDVS